MSKRAWRACADALISAAAVAIVVIVIVAADARVREQAQSIDPDGALLYRRERRPRGCARSDRSCGCSAQSRSLDHGPSSSSSPQQPCWCCAWCGANRAAHPGHRARSSAGGAARVDCARPIGAELVLADSAERALRELGDRIPDLILTPQLLSPRDDAAITDRLRQLGAAAATVQTLTIPALATHQPRSQARGRGLLSKLRRPEGPRQAPGGCAPDVFAEQIAVYLERALEARTAHTEVAAPAAAPLDVAIGDPGSTTSFSELPVWTSPAEVASQPVEPKATLSGRFTCEPTVSAGATIGAGTPPEPAAESVDHTAVADGRSRGAGSGLHARRGRRPGTGSRGRRARIAVVVPEARVVVPEMEALPDPVLPAPAVCASPRSRRKSQSRSRPRNR